MKDFSKDLKKNKIKYLGQNLFVLDCTFRDGGYYNQWDFSPRLTVRYLNSMKNAGVDVIEIGFRSLPKNDGFLGGFAYCTDDFLMSLDLPDSAVIAVMINAKEFLSHPAGISAAIDTIFQSCDLSPVDLVRVAVSADQLIQSKPLFYKLKELGYLTTINLMQANGIEKEHLSKMVSTVQDWGVVDVFYFADSLGNMTSDQICETASNIRRHWRGPTGVHAHDNMGRALSNTLAAVDAGVTWMDGTVLGMGRGAGNTCLELLLLELKRRNRGNYYPEGMFPIVIEDFEELRSKHKWGANLLYYLSGVYNVHPTYVQEMLSRTKHKIEQIIPALEFLRDSNSNAYNNENLARAIDTLHAPSKGSWKASGWAKGKSILILGSGPNLEHYAKDIIRFIEKYKPLVISLNINQFMPVEYVTAFAACHRTRLLLDSDKYEFLKKPIFVPFSAIPEMLQDRFLKLELMDYGMTTQKDTFKVEATGCIIPLPLVAAYVLALSIACEAENIFLTGFDGYASSDPRHQEMESVFELYKKHPKSVPLMALTPTTYSVTKSSIYSPVFNSNPMNFQIKEGKGE